MYSITLTLMCSVARNTMKTFKSKWQRKLTICIFNAYLYKEHLQNTKRKLITLPQIK